MTIREINTVIRTGKPVIAIDVLDGLEHQGRILRARRKKGITEVLTLGTHRWAALTSETTVWEAK